MIQTIGLLICSNVFMTFAWYGHLKHLDKTTFHHHNHQLGIAFFGYCFQVPANRMGTQYFNLAQLKIIQEVITMIIFSLFAIFYMKEPLNKNFLWASFCLIGAVYFIFKKNN